MPRIWRSVTCRPWVYDIALLILPILTEKNTQGQRYNKGDAEHTESHSNPVVQKLNNRFNPGDVSFCDNPFFCRTWLQYMNSKHIKKQLSDLSITEDMHRHGINMRHLGRVRCLITEEGLRRLLLTEMVARFAKQTLRGKLRKNKPQASSATLEEGEPVYAGEPMSAVSIVVDLFNEIIGAPTRTQEGQRKRWVFWDQVSTHPSPSYSNILISLHRAMLRDGNKNCARSSSVRSLLRR